MSSSGPQLFWYFFDPQVILTPYGKALPFILAKRQKLGEENDASSLKISVDEAVGDFPFHFLTDDTAFRIN